MVCLSIRSLLHRSIRGKLQILVPQVEELSMQGLAVFPKYSNSVVSGELLYFSDYKTHTPPKFGKRGVRLRVQM